MSYFYTPRGEFLHSSVHDVPNDAVALSEQRHAELLDALTRGQKLTINDGSVDIGDADPHVPDLLAMQKALAATVDADAETIRSQYITTGAGQAMAYLEKASQAKAYLAATDPVDADYPLLVAEVGITGETVFEVATVIDTMQNQWMAICAQIEPIRIGAKEQIKAADTVEAAQAIYDAIVWPSD